MVFSFFIDLQINNQCSIRPQKGEKEGRCQMMLTDGQIVTGIGVTTVFLVLSATFLAWADLMWAEWQVKLTAWREAGRLWSVVLTTLILVEAAFVFVSFYNQSPTWLVIVHHAYVVVALSWLAYAAYTIKALERSVRKG